MFQGMEAESFRRDVCGTLSTYPSLRFYFRDEGEKRERTRGGGGAGKRRRNKGRKKERKNDEFARFPRKCQKKCSFGDAISHERNFSN